MFKQKELKSTKIGFGEGLRDAGRIYPEVLALGADITGSVGMDIYRNEFPNRFFSFGIAEQNIVGVAAGLALSGKKPFLSTYSVFAALRTTDQIRVSLCYNKLQVKIGGAHAGISVGPDGATHQALEDIAVMRVLPNMTILSPCDATQTRLAVLASIKQVDGPVYIRFGREAVPDFTSSEMEFVVGKGQLLAEGEDATIIATGHMVWESYLAHNLLLEEGIKTRVVNLHTLKPIDRKLIEECAMKTGCIVTAEEHQIIGGLGRAVAEVLGATHPVPLEYIGMKDRFGESGQPDELMEKYELKAANIADAVRKVISRKNLSRKYE
jgi:transketolase